MSQTHGQLTDVRKKLAESKAKGGRLQTSLATAKQNQQHLRVQIQSLEVVPNSTFELCNLLQHAWDDGKNTLF